jgi:hypothetical protein
MYDYVLNKVGSELKNRLKVKHTISRKKIDKILISLGATSIEKPPLINSDPTFKKKEVVWL